MTRTDVHSPKNIRPEDYEYVCSYYLGGIIDDPTLTLVGQESFMRKQYRQWLTLRSRNADIEGNFTNKGTCDHCGASYLYGEMWTYLPTGHNVHVGHTCAGTTMNLSTNSAADYKRIQKAVKQQAELRAANARESEWAMDSRDGYTFLMDNQGEDFYGSLRNAIRKYGHLTAAQQTALDNGPANKAAYQQRQAEREERAAAKEANKATLVEGKGLRVSGTIISTKEVETQYGVSFKMLVEQADGSRVFGTIPTSLSTVQAGDTVTLTANVSVSDNDSSFGFFSRPRKATMQGKD